MKFLNNEVKILPAQAKDFANLLSLSKKSGYYFDYIEQALKGWLIFPRKSDKRFTEILYFNEEIAGFGSHIVFKDYVFGEMLRIDKTFQRRGLGTFFINRGLEIARDNKLNKLRTAILASGRGTFEFFKKVGFREIGKWEISNFEPIGLLPKKIKGDYDMCIARPSDLPDILKFIKANPDLFSQKMYVENFSWRAFDEDNISEEILMQRVLIKSNKERIESICFYNNDFTMNEGKSSILEINCFTERDLDFLFFLLNKHQEKIGLFRFCSPFPGLAKFPPTIHIKNENRLIFNILEKSF